MAGTLKECRQRRDEWPVSYTHLFYSNQNNLLILPGECTISITAVSNNALFMESTPATATYTVQKGEVGIPTINSVTVNADGVLTVDLLSLIHI